jgi:hypothetical protein
VQDVSRFDVEARAKQQQQQQQTITRRVGARCFGLEMKRLVGDKDQALLYQTALCKDPRCDECSVTCERVSGHATGMAEKTE